MSDDATLRDGRVSGESVGEGPSGGARCWRQVIALDAALHDERQVHLLTPEARVLLHLHLSGPVPVSTAMRAAGISYRGFYAVLARLKLAGLVATVKDAKDQRVKRLSLDPALPFSRVRP